MASPSSSGGDQRAMDVHGHPHPHAEMEVGERGPLLSAYLDSDKDLELDLDLDVTRTRTRGEADVNGDISTHARVHTDVHVDVIPGMSGHDNENGSGHGGHEKPFGLALAPEGRSRTTGNGRRIRDSPLSPPLSPALGFSPTSPATSYRQQLVLSPSTSNSMVISAPGSGSASGSRPRSRSGLGVQVAGSGTGLGLGMGMGIGQTQEQGTRHVQSHGHASPAMSSTTTNALGPYPPLSPPISITTGGLTLTGSQSRGSMILYRLSSGGIGTGIGTGEDNTLLPPPGLPTHGHAYSDGAGGFRSSVYSASGDSIVSLGADSKYPLMGMGTSLGGPTRPGTPGTPTLGGLGGRSSINSRGGVGVMSMSFSGLGLGMPSTQSEFGTLHQQQQRRAATEGGNGVLIAYAYDPDEDEGADELDAEEEEWVRAVRGRVVSGGVGSRSSSSRGKGEETSENGNGNGNGDKGKSVALPPLPLPSKSHSSSAKHPFTHPARPPPTYSLHSTYKEPRSGISWRGLTNVTMLIVLLSALLSLFVVYPITQAFSGEAEVTRRILGNTKINGTGQAMADLEMQARRDGWKGREVFMFEKERD